MPPKGTTSTRRTILRFDLAGICIDDRPNAYRNPQLVLKPQLELAPRRPYTGSRPRMPVWRHFLMVHVKDKADELLKLDLASFRRALDEAGPGPDRDHSITCSPPSCSLRFRYPKTSGSGSSTLDVTLKTAAALDTVLQELGALDANIEFAVAQAHDFVPSPAAAWSPLSPRESVSPVYRPFNLSRQLDSSSPPLSAVLDSQGRYYQSYPGFYGRGAVFHRLPSQPVRQPATQPTSYRPWSPGVVPSRPATTLGVPGILGEGIYKVSKVGSTSSTRPRLKRISTVLGPRVPPLYKVSEYFDHTVGGEGGLRVPRARFPGPDLPPTLQARRPASYLARSSSLGAKIRGHSPIPAAESSANLPPSTLSTAEDSVRVDQHQPARLRRLRTVHDAQESTLPAWSNDSEDRLAVIDFTKERSAGFALSQPETGPRAANPLDDASLLGSSQTLFESPTKQGVEDGWLLVASQLQHEGLCEASRVWDELMEMGAVEVTAAGASKDLSEALSKYESEFTKRWEGVVAATVRKMWQVQIGKSFAF